ncbi:MAG: DUF3426 domain-containing protein [Zoogloeaceae bacterium]|jgi:predicted Zn finger-like uncharacterized protein|nr:DUF3426 domain-containing protein [Zoogloeaceae bacterium]
MLTRCPHCRTAFRASREQLALRDGQVRCGACQKPFNAFTHRIPEESAHGTDQSAERAISAAQKAPSADAPSVSFPALHLDSLDPLPETVEGRQPPLFPADAQTEFRNMEIEYLGEAEETEEGADLNAPESHAPLDPIDAALAAAEGRQPGKRAPISAEEARRHALDTGLAAARHTRELPGFSSWNAAPLEGRGETTYMFWPFALAALVLALFLAAQAGYHYRSVLVAAFPASGAWFRALQIEVPPGRRPESLSILASELQTLGAPDRLQLLVTLRNQARQPQAWPCLELTLTDVYGAVVARRVFQPTEYLTRAQAATDFLPGDVALKLDIGAREFVPTGYKLYLFYV